MVVTTCTSDVVNNLVKITSLFLLFFTKPWFRESGENSLKPRTKHSVLYIYFLKTEIVIFYFSSNVNSQRAYVKKSFLSQILHPTFKPKRWETCLSPDLHLKAFFSSDFDKSFQISDLPLLMQLGCTIVAFTVETQSLTADGSLNRNKSETAHKRYGEDRVNQTTAKHLATS